MKKKTERSRGRYDFHEVIADICYQAGITGYYSGDSRADISLFVEWAHQFEDMHAQTEWGTGDNDYMTEIEKFTETKLTEAVADLRDRSDYEDNAPSLDHQVTGVLVTALKQCITAPGATCFRVTPRRRESFMARRLNQISEVATEALVNATTLRLSPSTP